MKIIFIFLFFLFRIVSTVQTAVEKEMKTLCNGIMKWLAHLPSDLRHIN